MLLGGQAKQTLLTGLSKQNPLEFMAQFKAKNGLTTQAGQAILALLDLHKIPRSSVYESLFNHLTEKFMHSVETLSRDKVELGALLELPDSFSVKHICTPFLVIISSLTNCLSRPLPIFS